MTAKTTKKPAKRTLNRTLYFAYGANTNIASMAARCPLAKPHGKMILQDHKLVFRGVADVVEAEGRSVFGALWWITSKCERSLDRFEGFPNFYIKQYGTVTIEGEEHVVMFYVMKEAGFPSPPYYGYERTLREGYASFDLPLEQIDLAIKEGPAVKHRFSDLADLWQ